MLTKIELRVHAGAPSRRTDDERYRAQAEAYSAFTGRRVNLEPAPQDEAITRQETLYDETTEDLDAVRRTKRAPVRGITAVTELPISGHISSTIAEKSHPTVQMATRHVQSPNNESVVSATEYNIAQTAEMDDLTAFTDYESPTFVEDTQLAYTALESQLFTSSRILPDYTPFKKRRISDGEDEASPWPADLDGHSPEQPISNARQPSGPSNSSQSEQASKSSQGSTHHSTVLHGLGKKRRVEHQPPVFKPFKLPIKRTVSEVLQPRVPLIEEDVEPREALSQQSWSSYLKTPILNRSAIRMPAQDVETDRDLSSREPQDRILDTPLPLHPQGHRADLTDYRERTPHDRTFMPYMPLQDGIAYVGVPSTPEHRMVRGVPRMSQVSGDGNETTSELPSSYDLSDHTTQSLRAQEAAEREKGGVALAEESVDEEAIAQLHSSQNAHAELSSSPPTAFRDVPTRDEPEIPKHAVVQHLSPPAQVSQPHDSTPSDHHSRPATQAPLPTTPVLPSRSITDLPKTPPALRPTPAPKTFSTTTTTIRPPSPAPSTAPFTTHITDALRFLATDSGIPYVPISTSRELRLLERGHWVVNTSPWSAELRTEFWAFLERVVGSGGAGWGVWCSRGDESAIGGRVEMLGVGGEDEVKIFCWGEVVRHVYLMLYVASKSKVRKAGLVWVDGGGEVVVRMRGPGD